MMYTPPFDLRAAEKRLHRRLEQRAMTDRYDSVDMQEEEDVRMIIAHCRETRAVLIRIREWAATEAPGWTHMIDTVLALTRDEEAPREAKPSTK